MSAGAVLAGGAPRLAAEVGRERSSSGGKVLLGCCAYSYRDQLTGKDKANPMTMDDFIEKAAALGCDGVELTSYYFQDPPTREYLLGLKRKCFLMGLGIAGMPIRTDFCQAPGEKRDEQVAYTKMWIRRAAMLGAPTVRVFAGGDMKKDVPQQRQWFVDSVNECLPLAAEHGIFLAMEVHGGIVPDADNTLALVNMVDSPWFGVTLDCGNFRDPDPYAGIARVVPHALVAHIKTEVFGAGGKKEPADLGRIMKILKDGGFRGYASLEYEAAEPAPIAVPRVLAELRRHIDS